MKVILIRPASMLNSIEILDDEKDKNEERDEAKLKLLVCVTAPFGWMCYLFITRKVTV